MCVRGTSKSNMCMNDRLVQTIGKSVKIAQRLLSMNNTNLKRRHYKVREQDYNLIVRSSKYYHILWLLFLPMYVITATWGRMSLCRDQHRNVDIMAIKMVVTEAPFSLQIYSLVPSNSN